MTRLAPLLVSGAVATGCVCSPMQCDPSKGCIDEAKAITMARRNARTQLLLFGSCFGASGTGSWVRTGSAESLRSTVYFDGTGKLRAQENCSGSACKLTGFGFKPRTGALTRNLCDEARSELLNVGVAMEAFTPVVVRRADGGVVTPHVVGLSRRERWILEPGNYTAQLGESSNAIPFEVPPNGHVVKPLDDTRGLPRSLTFADGLSLPDGGIDQPAGDD